MTESKSKAKAKPKSRASKARKSAKATKSAGTGTKAKRPAKRVAQRKPSAQVQRATAKSGAKAKTSGAQAGSTKPRKGEQVVLLSGGNPQIAKGDGDAPVQAYIAAMPGWKSDVGKRLDALIVQTVPNVRKAVKWNSPFYGTEAQGWFMAFRAFTRYVKVTFVSGMSLKPVPPGPSKDKNMRFLDIYEGELDEAQFASWVKQAAALPGWIQ